MASLVRSGKVLYLGTSSMLAWQFGKALHIAGERGWSRFVSMQNHLNLLYREEEREMLPQCLVKGIGVMPGVRWTGGRLARPWSDEPTTNREQTDAFGSALYARTRDADRAVIDNLGAISGRLRTPRGQIALAWLLQKSVVTSPIVGVSKIQHLDGALAALKLEFDSETDKALQSPYAPHLVAGFA